MFTVTIDDKILRVEPGTTVFQACRSMGTEIPHFCYHERLSIAGNCRMCLVEIEKSPKPVASCAMPVADGMKIHTNTESVRLAREGVMEFLLINHPLDCPICDQGGECDLQDQAMGYGRDFSRYLENKRAVDEKQFGPLIQTYMTRCIHCTRCVRFMEEVAGTPHLGGLWRGEDLEIFTTIETGLSSELSGNIIDLCPVGALTSRPYAFSSRSWELRKIESVDVLDGVGSNIRVDARGNQVMRILPRVNDDINQEWIGDKTRFAYDGLLRQRLDRPYVRNAKGKLQPATWEKAFASIKDRLDGLDGSQIGGIAGNLCDCESMLALKDLMILIGSPNIDCRQDGAALPANLRAGYLFNSTIAGIDDADLCLLIGSNPRLEAPIINARLRKRWLRGDFSVSRIGAIENLTYLTTELGEGALTLKDLALGEHEYCQELKNAERPMLVLGQGPLGRPDGSNILAAALLLASHFDFVKENWNGFNVLHTAAARVGGMDLGVTPKTDGLSTRGMLKAAKNGDLKALYLLGADEIDMSVLGDTFVIYQGHHGDRGAHRADVVLPGAAYTEKSGYYVNTEGRPQLGLAATRPPGDAREDWAILRALSESLGHTLPYDNISELREMMIAVAPHFANLDSVEPAIWEEFGEFNDKNLEAGVFESGIKNYYMTDPVSRASHVMADCSHCFRKVDGAA